MWLPFLLKITKISVWVDWGQLSTWSCEFGSWVVWPVTGMRMWSVVGLLAFSRWTLSNVRSMKAWRNLTWVWMGSTLIKVNLTIAWLAEWLSFNFLILVINVELRYVAECLDCSAMAIWPLNRREIFKIELLKGIEYLCSTSIDEFWWDFVLGLSHLK